MARLSAALLVAALFAACRNTPTDPVQVRRIIDVQNANLARWYAAGDIDSVASAFAPDAWQMPPNAAPLVGREAIRRF